LSPVSIGNIFRGVMFRAEWHLPQEMTALIPLIQILKIWIYLTTSRRGDNQITNPAEYCKDGCSPERPALPMMMLKMIQLNIER
jgi:hypothetical protein